ncbi:hypothetical protein O3P69_007140 [Scylla paramamosain]|uniref:Calcitonin receptor n=1 Tax=Scylla paramamosain TaxID=85552 RepID=A0AAW0V6G0_SCYPA
MRNRRVLLMLVTLLWLSRATISTSWERGLMLKDAGPVSSLSMPCTPTPCRIHVPNWMKEKEVLVDDEEEEEFEEEELNETWKEFAPWKTFKEDFQLEGKEGKAKGGKEKEVKKKEEGEEGKEMVEIMKNKVKRTGKDDIELKHYKTKIKKKKAFQEGKEKEEEEEEEEDNVELIFHHYEDYLQDFAAEEEEEEKEVERAQVSSSALLESFRGEEGRAKWKKCCKEAVSCCTWMLSAPWPTGFCPNTWDTWQCWPASSPGTVARRPCPSYVYFDKKPACTKKATKSCEVDGKWMRRLLPGGEAGPEWSNYTTCSVHESIHRRLHVHIGAYTLSVFALLPALCIFFCYKQLRVPRITLHKHLFLSLLLNAAGVIAQRLLQLHYSQWIEKSPLWCVALTLINRYTSLTCYMWYFCEGLYLHTLLVSAFTEQRSLLMFYLTGWGLPAVVMVVYGGLRSLLQLGDERCWMLPAEGGLDWLINLPPLLAILANIVFLFNIIRILVSKVRAGRGSEPSQYRKAVRATLMVVPLFGLQYVVTLYRLQELGCDWPHVYQLANNIIEGSTGWLVAVIFCYTNGEVLSLLGRSIQRRRTLHKLGRRGGAEGQTTPAPAPPDAKGLPPTALAPEGVGALLGRSWGRYRERRASLPSARQAPRSRSFSTAQTSLLEPPPYSRHPGGASGSAGRIVFTRGASRGERVSISLNAPLPGRPSTPPLLTEAPSSAERDEGVVLPLLPPAL